MTSNLLRGVDVISGQVDAALSEAVLMWMFLRLIVVAAVLLPAGLARSMTFSMSPDPVEFLDIEAPVSFTLIAGSMDASGDSEALFRIVFSENLNSSQSFSFAFQDESGTPNSVFDSDVTIVSGNFIALLIGDGTTVNAECESAECVLDLRLSLLGVPVEGVISTGTPFGDHRSANVAFAPEPTVGMLALAGGLFALRRARAG